MTVQRLHDPDPRQHGITSAAAQHQHLDRRLPFRQVGFLFRQLRDVVGRVHVQAIIVAVDQYAEKALGNRDYFLNKPYGVG
jgi:hypothetical protein